MKKGIIKIIAYIVEGMIIEWLGGWDIFISSLFLLIVIDVISGLIKSVLCKSEKSKGGGLCSHSMFVGGIRKLLILVIVVVSNALDDVFFDDNAYIRSAVLGYYIVNESISIVENLGMCGVQLPPFLNKVLDNLSDVTERGKNNKK
ncbi:MAG: phage holin family protein [Clostridia bacterium]|nr:phage holin family protein [Clostridia bacterium]